MSKIAF
jgi:hypothetical protein